MPMVDFPVRLLLTGYGIAAAVAVLLGDGFISGALIFWLGGAASVIMLAATPGLNRPFVREQIGTESGEYAGARNIVSEDELALWDRDRELEALNFAAGMGREQAPKKAKQTRSA